MKKYGNVLNVFNILAEEYLKTGMIAVDATCGNGFDSEMIKRCIGNSGSLYAFDLQKIAIENTTLRLKKENLLTEKDHMIMDSHHNMDSYICESTVDFIVFNLGYLPGSNNKTFTTLKETTLKAIEIGLTRLKQNGVLFILSYLGHQSGLLEFEAVEYLTKSLDQEIYDVMKIQFVNQKNNPPQMWCIEKK